MKITATVNGLVFHERTHRAHEIFLSRRQVHVRKNKKQDPGLSK